jgi:hypothetical protein
MAVHLVETKVIQMVVLMVVKLVQLRATVKVDRSVVSWVVL